MINEATLRYALQHEDSDVRTLALRGCKDPQVDLTMALQQIQGRQTARRKLPSWAAVEGIVYPPHLNMEQCSSELTARYKREIADGLPSPRSRLLDLTGGFGVDFAFMAEAFSEAVYVERDAALCALATHNLAFLGRSNARIVCADAVGYLSTVTASSDGAQPPFTLVFLDPARRDAHGGRTYALADCTPDVTTLMPCLLRCAGHVLLKLSPMLDWRKAVADLAPHPVSEVHIVAVDNECRELLLLLTPGSAGSQQPVPRLFCIDLHSRDGSRTCFSPQPFSSETQFVTPQQGHDAAYLYEPNAAVMKAGCFRELAASFGIGQLAPNSHLFTSASPVAGFPGRCFRITATSTMNKRDLRAALGHLERANIAVRNFPLTAGELRRRLKLADGGTDYIFATTLATGEHIVMLCNKVTVQ